MLYFIHIRVLISRTGILVFALKGCDSLERTKESLSINNIPYQFFHGNEVATYNKEYETEFYVN